MLPAIKIKGRSLIRSTVLTPLSVLIEAARSYAAGPNAGGDTGVYHD